MASTLVSEVSLFSLRIVSGEPITVRPNADRKFQRNKRAGGGAFIPAVIKIEGPHEFKETVLNRVRDTPAECENGDMMSADVESDCDV